MSTVQANKEIEELIYSTIININLLSLVSLIISAVKKVLSKLLY
jgi:hypothetical protein